MENEKRMAGSYAIIQAFRIGDREIVLGEDLNAKPEEHYMCAYCQQNEIAALYNEVMVSDDYCEIVKLFAERLSEQAEKTRAEVLRPKFQGIDVTPLTNKDCTPITYDDDLNGKVVVIRPGVLRREYQLDRYALGIVILGVGGGRIPAEHGACHHSGLLRPGDTCGIIEGGGSLFRGNTLLRVLPCGGIAFFAFGNGDDLTGAFQSAETLLRERLAQGNNLDTAALRQLRKLADVVEIVSNLQMGFIHKTAGLILCLTGGEGHADTVTVRNAELLLVAGGDKPNTVLGIPHIPVQVIPFIAIDTEIVVAGTGIQPQKVGVVLGIYPKTRFIPSELRRGGLAADIVQTASVRQNAAVLWIFPQSVDYLVQLCLKFWCFQIRHVVKPAGEKLLSGGAKVPTQIPDTSRLGIQLVALPIGVFLLGLGQFSQFH